MKKFIRAIIFKLKSKLIQTISKNVAMVEYLN